MTDNAKEITLEFEHERDTKNMRRYQETASSPDMLYHPDSESSRPLVGTLYLLKEAADWLGNPVRLHVRIHVGQQEVRQPNRSERRRAAARVKRVK